MQDYTNIVLKIAHDVGGPLGNSTMFLSLAEQMLEQAKNQGGLQASELESLINIIQNVSLINAKLERQIRSWSSVYLMRENAFKVQTERIDFSAHVKKVVNKNELYIQQKNLKVELNIEENIQIVTDKEIVKLVIDNLLTQSIIFAEPNYPICIQLLSDKTNAIFTLKQDVSGDMQKLMSRFTDDEHVVKGDFYEDGLLKATAFGMVYSNGAIRQLGGKTEAIKEGKELKLSFSLPLI